MSGPPATSAIANPPSATRTRLLPLLTLGVTLAAVLGVLIPHLDARVDASVPGWLDSVVFGGDADAARTVLDGVASSPPITTRAPAATMSR